MAVDRLARSSVVRPNIVATMVDFPGKDASVDDLQRVIVLANPGVAPGISGQKGEICRYPGKELTGTASVGPVVCVPRETFGLTGRTELCSTWNITLFAEFSTRGPMGAAFLRKICLPRI
jgi:hypothetical protein